MKRILSLALGLLALLCAPFSLAASAQKPVITDITEIRGLVTISAQSEIPLKAYCLVWIDRAPPADSADWLPMSGDSVTVFKTDGQYTAFVQDEEGNVSEGKACAVSCGFLTVIDAEGLTYPTEPLSQVLLEKGSSLEEVNGVVYENVALAGMYTRNAAVIAAVTLASELAKLGLTVPYLLGGSYQAETDWGLNPDWGKELAKPVRNRYETFNNQGMHCVAILTWSLKQAGLNTVNSGTFSAIGKNGAHSREGDNVIAYNKGQGGDIFTTGTGHSFMILDRLDQDGDGYFDSYLTLEMISPRMTLAVHAAYSIRYLTLYDMSAVFDDTGAYRRYAKYWENTYYIPREAWPLQLQQAAEKARETRAVEKFLVKLGLER